MRKLLPLAETPEAIRYFDRHAWKLSNYGYWFTLSTLWVSYTGWSELETWKKCFSADRPGRETSIMKPSELAAFRALPDPITAYRAHRPGETDWIAYTTDPKKAAFFAKKRGVEKVSVYRIPKSSALCYFLRRGENEILVLDKSAPEFVMEAKIIVLEVAI